MFFRLLHGKVTDSPFPRASVGGRQRVQRTRREWGVMLNALRHNIHTNYLPSFSTGFLSLLQFMRACMFVGMRIFNHLLTLVWTHVRFIHWVIIQGYFYWLCCSNWSIWLLGAFQLFPIPRWSTSSWQVCGVRCVSMLSIFLVSGITKYPRLIMYISCPNPRTSHLQGVWFPLLDNSIRNQDPSAGCAHSYWYVIDSRSSQPAV